MLILWGVIAVGCCATTVVVVTQTYFDLKKYWYDDQD